MGLLRVLILGGYGTFGGRLAELLAADPRFELLIAGRSEAKARACIANLQLGAAKSAAVLDRDVGQVADVVERRVVRAELGEVGGLVAGVPEQLAVRRGAGAGVEDQHPALGPAGEAPHRHAQVGARCVDVGGLAWLASETKLPIVLKGILHPDDAVAALEHGLDGVYVSNHGGRQVDGAIATMDALPAVVEAVGGRVPVVLDSGVRSGADLFRALALGATAVGLGRPYVWGLATGGADGVREVIRNLRADFDLTLGLSGVARVADVGRDNVTRA